MKIKYLKLFFWIFFFFRRQLNCSTQQKVIIGLKYIFYFFIFHLKNKNTKMKNFTVKHEYFCVPLKFSQRVTAWHARLRFATLITHFGCSYTRVYTSCIVAGPDNIIPINHYVSGCNAQVRNRSTYNRQDLNRYGIKKKPSHPIRVLDRPEVNEYTRRTLNYTRHGQGPVTLRPYRMIQQGVLCYSLPP